MFNCWKVMPNIKVFVHVSHTYVDNDTNTRAMTLHCPGSLEMYLVLEGNVDSFSPSHLEACLILPFGEVIW